MYMLRISNDEELRFWEAIVIAQMQARPLTLAKDPNHRWGEIEINPIRTADHALMCRRERLRKSRDEENEVVDRLLEGEVIDDPERMRALANASLAREDLVSFVFAVGRLMRIKGGEEAPVVNEEDQTLTYGVDQWAIPPGAVAFVVGLLQQEGIRVVTFSPQSRP